MAKKTTMPKSSLLEGLGHGGRMVKAASEGELKDVGGVLGPKKAMVRRKLGPDLYRALRSIVSGVEDKKKNRASRTRAGGDSY